MPSLFAWLRRIYSLDTLDTRFTASAITPNNSTDTRPAAKDARANSIAQNARPSLWRTPEFFVYYLFFITLVPLMFKTVIDASKESNPAYATYSELLSPGWIPGRLVDNSDAQYASVRDNIPYLFLLLVAHPIARRAYQSFSRRPNGGTKQPSVATAGEVQFDQRMRFDFAFGIIFIVALHGISALKIFFILFVNYRIGKSLPRSYVPAATWTFNICILFANELLGGYQLEPIAMFLSPGSGTPSEKATLLVQWARQLDDFGGIMPRWEVLFKVTVLRLISFNMDYYWSVDYPAASPIEKKQLDPTALSDRDRVKIPAEPAAFTPRNYIAYILYSPLYLAGPILTFNDYASQQRYTAPSLTRTRTILYGVRFFLTFLCMEFILHYIYAVAISKASPDWSVFTPGQLSMLAFFNLHIIWLKLLIPWRFFRLWALVDGIDPPRKYGSLHHVQSSANPQLLAGVHLCRSLARYQPPPIDVGLASNALRSPRGFGWYDVPAKRWSSRPTTYRVLCGMGSVANVLMMMIANLVGFALGLDGMKDLLAGLTGSYSGIAYMISCCIVLFVGVQVMFEIREDELRMGINLKC
ncbi:Membrane bound O-acyl transferase MBOAT [Penicillium hetheringtonii]|uniref:Membrane bound O-acyl transferase MBOAT n=1 Tax=Penicillium hetheringtonii TaxID=911720 RepID=A0AAD6DXX4_9EURO|nr:Membrane bound O-acyl transferase MBOAT [Penicillium hetheringtonii]